MIFQHSPEKEVLSIKELAAFIGFNPDTVYDWAKYNGMPIHRVGPRGRIRVHYSEFKIWYSERREA